MTPEGRAIRWPTAGVLVVVLAVATALRVYGLYWGLPDERHLFSYHPDEYFSLQAVWSFAAGTLDPRYYNYGTLYFYLVLLATLWRGDALLLERVPESMRALVLDARVVTVILGVATVLVLYFAGRELYGRRAGLAGAAVLAVMPLHAIHGHFATVDVPIAFWTVVCLYFAARIVRADEATTPRRPFLPYLLGGAAAGLAAATKYNGGLAILFVVVAHVVVARQTAPAGQWWRAFLDRRLAVALFCLVAAFLIACPWPVLNFRQWWGGPDQWSSVRYEIEHMRRGDSPAIVEATPPGLVFHLIQSLAYGCTWPLLAVALVGLGYALRRRARADWVVLVFVFAWYVMIGLAKTRYMRYTVPLLPPLALVTGRLLMVRGVAQGARGGLRAAGIAVGWVCVALAAAYTVRYDASMAGPSEQGRMADLILSEAPPGATMGTLGPLWYCHPPVGFVNGGRVLNSKQVWRTYERSPYALLAVGFSVIPRTDYLIVTEAEVAYERLADSTDWQALQAALAEYELVPGQPSPPWTPHRLFPLPLTGPLPPADWRYPFPGIALYRLKAADAGR